MHQVCNETNKKVAGFSDDAMRTLQRHRWPGNVRELQNVIERAVLLGKGGLIGMDDLPGSLANVGGVTRSSPWPDAP